MTAHTGRSKQLAAAFEAESLGWLPLGNGAYLHVGDYGGAGLWGAGLSFVLKNAPEHSRRSPGHRIQKTKQKGAKRHIAAGDRIGCANQG